jgi:2-keto-4-pentenoate hydratase/2-oxohepta-3-ene-1,7-dioic acid hydratase in catechol pathway
MKIARFRVARRTAYGVVTGEELVEIRGSIYTRFRLTDIRYPLGDVKLLPPTDPANMWGPGLNFADHAQFAASVLGESNPSTPNHPEPWHKSRNALTGHQDPIIIPRDSNGDVHYEGEAVAVIGKNCRRVTPAQAPRMILGYTCGNDVSDRTWQGKDSTFWRAKGSDSFAPVGPWIETDLDPQNLEVMVCLNGEEVQRAHTSDMLFSFAEIVSYISQQVTLRPGDLVFSGTTGVTRAMKPGDLVEVHIPAIGVLANPVVPEFDASAL